MHDFVPSVAPMELRRRWHAEGLWNDDTFPTLVARGLADNRSGRARVLSAVRPYEGTVGELADQGALLAGLLAARGTGPGDVVAFQLPNWPEAASTFYGLLQLGVVVVPIVHIYGHREVGHILRQSRARTLITADRFGSHDYLAELALAAPLPDLELVVVVDAHGPFPAPDAESLTWREVLAADKPFGAAATVDPDAPAFVCYTSGTTSDAERRRPFAPHVPRRAAPGRRVARPRGPGHGPGAGWVVGCAGRPRGRHVDALRSDRRGFWPEPPRPLGSRPGPPQRWRAERLTSGSGATFFLTSLLDHPDFDPAVHAPLIAASGWAARRSPRRSRERATALGISLTRSFGSTEHPSITGSCHADPEDIALYTDGAPAPRRRDPTRRRRRARRRRSGSRARSVAAVPNCFVGYTDPALPPPPSTPTAGTRPATSACSTTTGTSPSPTARRTSSSAAARTSAPRRSKRSCCACPTSLEVAVVAAPDARARRARVRVRAHERSDRRRPGSRSCARSSSTPASPGRSGPRTCASSTTSPAPRAARSRSTCCGPGCATNRANSANDSRQAGTPTFMRPARLPPMTLAWSSSESPARSSM